MSGASRRGLFAMILGGTVATAAAQQLTPEPESDEIDGGAP